MNFPKLQITKTDIKLDMQIQDPVQKISQPRPKQNIEQPAGKLDINISKGVLDIDQSQAWKDVGLLTPKESVQKYVADGRQAALKSISKTVQEGRQMMLNSGNGQQGSIIASIAKQNHGPHRVPINIKFIPSVGSVKTHYTPGKVDVNYTPQQPKIDVQVNQPTHDYQQGKVTHNTIQRPSIDIDFTE
ncbi:DUF6470 family protein [Ureibacillus chungkukjangi]|uniref:DUF6470 family protein n=1 Tax=Ureibacillus chungkukjangi TaxID=1202712 RepID=UPI00203EB5D7|nr:DUF6470 family protein [Ureibacillus chungkukjangi]MCM3389097.1 DUF6470 family protein [Ureibacillus chungkukjangi]